MNKARFGFIGAVMVVVMAMAALAFARMAQGGTNGKAALAPEYRQMSGLMREMGTVMSSMSVEMSRGEMSETALQQATDRMKEMSTMMGQMSEMMGDMSGMAGNESKGGGATANLTRANTTMAGEAMRAGAQHGGAMTTAELRERMNKIRQRLDDIKSQETGRSASHGAARHSNY